MSENYSKILSGISNIYRIKILDFLYRKLLSFSELTSKINSISNSEISRHLGRLTDRGLIQKEPKTGRNYEITPFGSIIFSLFKPIDFLLSHAEFFRTHDLINLPTKFYPDLKYLQKAKRVSGFGDVLFKGQEIMSKPMEQVWMMIDTRFPLEWTAKKINFIVPYKMKKLETTLDIESIDYRIVFMNEIPFFIFFNNYDEGLMCFPRIGEKKPDYSEAFLIQDSNGLSFLRKIFDHFWAVGERYK